MIVYQFDLNGIYIGPVELPNSPVLPTYHTFQEPPAILNGEYLVMRNGWKVMTGTPPVIEDISTIDEVSVNESSIRSCEPLDFIERFSEEEQIAIVTATLSNPQVKLWYDKMLASKNVNFDDVRTQAGMQALIDSGIITTTRSNEIVPQL